MGGLSLGSMGHLDQRQLYSLMASLLYASVAVAMGVVNKAVLIDFKYSNTLLMLQMAASATLIYLLKWINLVYVRDFEWRTARALVPVVFFYNANVGFALAGLRTLNLPMYHVLKRITPVLVLGGRYCMGGPAPHWQVTGSVLTIVAGCCIAGLGDLAFDPKGYALALTSCGLQVRAQAWGTNPNQRVKSLTKRGYVLSVSPQATYLVLVERSGGEKGITSTELLLYNSVLSLPVLVLLVVLTGEAQESFPAISALAAAANAPYFVFNLVISLVMGALLNYTLFLCTLANSALTTTVVGALKGAVATVVGFFVLGGGDFGVLSLLGIGINTLGGVWYTVAKFQSKKRAFHRHRHKPGAVKPHEAIPLLPLQTTPNHLLHSSSHGSSPNLISTSSGSMLPLLTDWGNMRDRAPTTPDRESADHSNQGSPRKGHSKDLTSIPL